MTKGLLNCPLLPTPAYILHFTIFRSPRGNPTAPAFQVYFTRACI